MRHFFLFVLLFFCHGLIAQEYSPFNADVSKRFVNANDEADDDYFFYSTSDTSIDDVIKFEQYYSTQSIDYDDVPGEDECGFWGGTIGVGLDTTWLGNTVFYDEVLKNLLLLNEEGDSLNFNFNMEIGDSALFYSSEAMRFFIHYTSIIQEDNLGVLDSCKYFTVQSYDGLDQIQNTTLSDFEIKISKEIGILSFIDCYHFPNEFIPIQLKGQTNPLLGDYQMTYLDAYPWSEGDVVQYKGSYSLSYSGGGYVVSKQVYETMTVTSRIVTEDSVYIYYSSEVAVVANWDPESQALPGIYIPLSSPIAFHVDDLILDKPHNFAIRDNSNPYLFYGEDDIEECGTDNAIRLRNQFASYCDSCLCYGSTDGFGSSVQSRSYKENKGHTGTSFSYYGSLQDNPSKSIGQTYSNINGTECGDLIVLNTEDVERNQFEVFPNPSTGKVSISSKIIPIGVCIYDLSGRRVYQNKKGFSFKNEIDLGNVGTGIYFLQLEYIGGSFAKKLIIQ
jgi:hypothetical protein